MKEYSYSTQANHRKGGLIGLAATAIALTEVCCVVCYVVFLIMRCVQDTNQFLELLLPPVLKCFSDQVCHLAACARADVLMCCAGGACALLRV